MKNGGWIMTARLRKRNLRRNDTLPTPLFAPDSSLTSSLPVLGHHLLASFLVSMQHKDQWTANPKIVKVKTVLSVGKSKSHAHRQGQSWEKEKSDSPHSPTASNVTARIRDISQTSAHTHAPVDGAGRPITPIRSALHPISPVQPPNVSSLSIISIWGQYAPPHSSRVTIRMSPALQQETTMVT